MKGFLLTLLASLLLTSCMIGEPEDSFTSLECSQQQSCFNFAARHCEKINKKPVNIRYSYRDERESGSGFVGSRYRRIYKAYYQCA